VSEQRPDRAEYARHAVPVADAGNIRAVLRALGALPGLIVVNLVEPGGAATVALSEESLANLLATGPETLIVETLPRATYQRVMRDKIELATREAIALRTILCSCAIGDVPTEASTVVRHVDQILFLLRSYALQDGRSRVTALIDALAARRQRLAESCFESGDNVRCMDDLQYEVVPVLQDVAQLFGST
jgi:hypothetical protein